MACHIYGRRFLQVTRPNQQYQSTEGKNATKEKSDNAKTTKYTYTYKTVHNKKIHI